MALKVGDVLRFRTLGSGSLPMMKMKEGGSQSYVAGDPLILDGSGGFDKAATSSALDVVGFACGAASSVEGTTGRYIPLTADVIIEAACAGDSEATLALQSSHIGHGAHLINAACSGNAWYARLGTSSSASFRVVGFRDATGTVHGRVFLRPTSLGIGPTWMTF